MSVLINKSINKNYRQIIYSVKKNFFWGVGGGGGGGEQTRVYFLSSLPLPPIDKDHLCMFSFICNM